MLTSRTPAKIESVVHSKIRAVLEDRLGESPTIRGIDKLNATLGLSSLDLAVIVAELEIELGADPFAKLVPITSVRSVDAVTARIHGTSPATAPRAESTVRGSLKNSGPAISAA